MAAAVAAHGGGVLPVAAHPVSGGHPGQCGRLQHGRLLRPGPGRRPDRPGRPGAGRPGAGRAGHLGPAAAARTGPGVRVSSPGEKVLAAELVASLTMIWVADVWSSTKAQST